MCVGVSQSTPPASVTEGDEDTPPKGCRFSVLRLRQKSLEDSSGRRRVPRLFISSGTNPSFQCHHWSHLSTGLRSTLALTEWSTVVRMTTGGNRGIVGQPCFG